MVSVRTLLPAWLKTGALAAVLAHTLPAQVVPGSIFPSLAAAGLSDASLPPTSGKVVIVDFWASWCAPCKASFPSYSRLQERYAARGLVIVGVGVDDSPSDFSSFVARLKPSFATVHDSQHKLVGAVQVPTMPTSYVIDGSGRVRFVHKGFHGAQTEHELQAEIESLLQEKPPSP